MTKLFRHKFYEKLADTIGKNTKYFYFHANDLELKASKLSRGN